MIENFGKKKNTLIIILLIVIYSRLLTFLAEVSSQERIPKVQLLVFTLRYDMFYANETDY